MIIDYHIAEKQSTKRKFFDLENEAKMTLFEVILYLKKFNYYLVFEHISKTKIKDENFEFRLTRNVSRCELNDHSRKRSVYFYINDIMSMRLCAYRNFENS